MNKEDCHPNAATTVEQWRLFSADVLKYIQNRTNTAIASDDLLLLVFKLIRRETRSPEHAKRIYMRIACVAMQKYLKEVKNGKRHGE